MAKWRVNGQNCECWPRSSIGIITHQLYSATLLVLLTHKALLLLMLEWPLVVPVPSTGWVQSVCDVALVTPTRVGSLVTATPVSCCQCGHSVGSSVTSLAQSPAMRHQASSYNGANCELWYSGGWLALSQPNHVENWRMLCVVFYILQKIIFLMVWQWRSRRCQSEVVWQWKWG